MPPGEESHVLTHLAKTGVRKMYVDHEDDVVPDAAVLENDRGYECTEEAVDLCIASLTKLGYGGTQTPGEIMASKVRCQDISIYKSISLTLHLVQIYSDTFSFRYSRSRRERP